MGTRQNALMFEEAFGFPAGGWVLSILHYTWRRMLNTNTRTTVIDGEDTPATSPPAQNALPLPVPTIVPARSDEFHCYSCVFFSWFCVLHKWAGGERVLRTSSLGLSKFSIVASRALSFLGLLSSYCRSPLFEINLTEACRSPL